MLTKIIVNNKEYSFDEYLKLENKFSYPYSIRKLIVESNSKKRKGWLSPSGFNACYRKLYWNYIYDYSETQEKLYITSRGTLIHKILEDIVPDNINTFKEVVLEYKLPYFTLYGNADLIQNGVLYDYKTIKDNKIEKMQDKYPLNYVYQLNIYKFMAENYLKIKINDIKIVFISMSGVYESGKVLDNITLPQFPIYPNNRILNYIEKKLEFIKNNTEVPCKQDYCNFCRWYNKCYNNNKGSLF